MSGRLGAALRRAAERAVPDPFVLALLLTLAVFAAGLARGPGGLGERAARLGEAWWAELFEPGLMKFALQMALVLLTGHALALSAPVIGAIGAVTRLARGARSAGALVVGVGALASLVNWGLGVVVGALLAREMGRRFAREGRAVHYPLLGAAGYAGFVVWHGGLSGSAPLKVAEAGHFMEASIGVLPVARTLGSPMNVGATACVVLALVATIVALTPRDPAQMVGYRLEPEAEGARAVRSARSGLVGWLESSRAVSGLFGAAVIAWSAYYAATRGSAGVNLDALNALFFGAGLVLHRSPRAYAEAVADGARGAAAIVVQFPVYFGVLGLLKGSGLIASLSAWVGATATAATLPLWTFVSAGLVNFFVPSGGGQLAVQGPLVAEAAARLGTDPARAIMALAYGDAWTNMLQPFWALPLLGIMGLEAKEIIGYTAAIFVVCGPIFAFWITFGPLG